MKVWVHISLFCLIASLAAFHVAAGDAPAGMAVNGKVLFEDDFGRAEMAPKWRVGKGKFEIKDGVVTATEIPEDKHGAYAYVTPNFLFKDIVTEFSVQIDGSRSCSLMINDSKYKESHAGHIIRVGFSIAKDEKAKTTFGKVDVADWKYGSMKNEIFDKMKDPATPADEKTKLRESIKDKSAAYKSDADLAQWHQIRVEIVGEELLVSIDGKPTSYLKSQGIDHATKNAIGFEVGGKSSNIKNMKVWEATAAPDWASKRDAVLGALKK